MLQGATEGKNNTFKTVFVGEWWDGCRIRRISRERDIADKITRNMFIHRGTKPESLQLSSESDHWNAPIAPDVLRNLIINQDIILFSLFSWEQFHSDSELQVSNLQLIGSQRLLIIAVDFMNGNIWNQMCTSAWGVPPATPLQLTLQLAAVI